MRILSVEGLSKRYRKKTVLQDVTFSVERGEAVGIIGRNGSGKSTLLSIIGGSAAQYGGSVFLDGAKLTVSAGRKDIGYVPQKDFLFDDLSVKDNLKFWAAAYGVSLDFSSPIISGLGLGGIRNEKCGKLSGGMRRRVMIASSVLHEPGYILLDEPGTGLDFYYKKALLDWIAGVKNRGKAVVYAGHDIDDIFVICERILLLEEGRVIIETNGNNGDAKQVLKEALANVI